MCHACSHPPADHPPICTHLPPLPIAAHHHCPHHTLPYPPLPLNPLLCKYMSMQAHADRCVCMCKCAYLLTLSPYPAHPAITQSAPALLPWLAKWLRWQHDIMSSSLMLLSWPCITLDIPLITFAFASSLPLFLPLAWQWRCNNWDCSYCVIVVAIVTTAYCPCHPHAFLSLKHPHPHFVSIDLCRIVQTHRLYRKVSSNTDLYRRAPFYTS